MADISPNFYFLLQQPQGSRLYNNFQRMLPGRIKTVTAFTELVCHILLLWYYLLIKSSCVVLFGYAAVVQDSLV